MNTSRRIGTLGPLDRLTPHKWRESTYDKCQTSVANSGAVPASSSRIMYDLVEATPGMLRMLRKIVSESASWSGA
ncbi:MAG: hypothetical protein ABIW81_08380, partial [Terrimesophilobacter sp.]